MRKDFISIGPEFLFCLKSYGCSLNVMLVDINKVLYIGIYILGALEKE